MKPTIRAEKIILNNNTFGIINKQNTAKPTILYSCKKCQKLCTSMLGAKEHVCPKSATYQNPTTNIPLIIEKLIKFVCVSNIPLRALDNIYFRKFLYLLNPNFDFPQRETMAKIYIYMKNWQKKGVVKDPPGAIKKATFPSCIPTSSLFMIFS